MNKLALSNQLCFSVYAVSRHITSLYRSILEELDITYPQYLVMLIMWEQSEVTVKQIGEQLYLDSGTLTPLLKRLEQKELIIRERSKTDERSVIVTLTELGRSKREHAKCIPENIFKALNISPEEYYSIKNQLDSILKNK